MLLFCECYTSFNLVARIKRKLKLGIIGSVLSPMSQSQIPFSVVKTLDGDSVSSELMSNICWTLAGLSNTIWIVVAVPQFITNFKNPESYRALSYTLLMCWLGGDILSILAALYIPLHKIIIATLCVHIVIDIIFITQWLYCMYITMCRQQMHLLTLLIRILNPIDFGADIYHLKILVLIVSQCLSIIVLLANTTSSLPAILIGYVACVVFAVSRLPQIILNWSRTHVSGLNIYTFVIVFCSNNLFLASILLFTIGLPQSSREHYIITNLQWIISINLSNIMDLVIFIQYNLYKNAIIETNSSLIDAS